VSKWKEEHGILAGVSSTTRPTESDDVHGPQFHPTITIQSPLSNTLYSNLDRVDVHITNKSKFPLSRLDIFVNGLFIGSTSQPPFSYSFLLSNQF